MKSLKIYLADLTYDTINLATDAFPLNIGFVAAYCKNKFKEQVDIELFKYPKDLEKAIRSSPPDILGMSNYPWNFNLGITFFDLIKKISPKTVTVMGGPNIPLFDEDRTKFILDNPLIDFYVYLEGEEAFSNLVERVMEYKDNLDKMKLTPINGIVHRIDQKNLIKGAWLKRRKILDEIPSPYLSGYLDKFFDGKLSPMVETNRGCPFTCTYCHEGHSLITKVNYFSKERVFEELDYIGNMVPIEVSHLMFVDPNFGMYERDLEICEHIAKMQKDKNYPRAIFASTGKNRKDRIAKAINKLNGTLKFWLSVQSMDQEVLKNIKRQNIDLDAMTSLVETYGKHKLPTSSEAILALPGETLESHINTLSSLLKTGVESITAYSLMLLNGTELTLRSSREKYGIQSHFRVIPRDFGKLSDDTISVEVEEIITSTNTMSFEEYLEGRVFHLLISTIWNIGIYEPFFKMMISKNLSPIEFFKVLKKDYKSSNSDFQNLIENFIKDSINELWKDKKALIKHAKIEANYKRLVRGEMGNNLIQTYMAKYMVNASKYNDFIYKKFKEILNFEKMSDEEQNFFRELGVFCLSKINNIWDENRETNNPLHNFNYDIISWDNSFNTNATMKVSNIKFEKPQKIEFRLSRQQSMDIKNNIARYGNTPTGIGRTIVKMGDPRKVLRAAQIIN
jgi:radical SAM superfamily enzyme YgiQ (UPF0313 family)